MSAQRPSAEVAACERSEHDRERSTPYQAACTSEAEAETTLRLAEDEAG